MRRSLTASALAGPLSLLFCAAPAHAQAPTATIPAGYLHAEGNARHHAGWRYRSGRALTVYAPELVQSRGFLIQSLWVRGDGPSNAAYAQSFELQAGISSVGVPFASTLSMQSFAASHGTDHRIFFPRQQVSFPGWSQSSMGPRPFSLELKGSAPFFVPPDAALCVDLQFFSPSQVTITSYADAQMFSRYGRTEVVASAAEPADFNLYASGMYVGHHDFKAYGYSRGAGELAVNWLGVQPVQVPLPGSQGALHTLPYFVHPQVLVTSGSSGLAQFSYGPLPAAFGGMRIWSQMASFTANGALKLSKGLEIEIGVGPSGVSAAQCVYGYESSTRSFDPSLSAPMYSSQTAIILGR
jgi:hypothetical protein